MCKLHVARDSARQFAALRLAMPRAHFTHRKRRAASSSSGAVEEHEWDAGIELTDLESIRVCKESRVRAETMCVHALPPYCRPHVHMLRASMLGESSLGTVVDSQLVMSSLRPVSPSVEYEL